MSNIFSQTEVLKMPRSLQKYFWSLFTSMDYGKLYPIFTMDCVPGDTIRIMGDIQVRARPMVFPNLTSNTLTMHFFFVPYRLLDENFAQGVIGTTEQGQAVNYDFPTWDLGATTKKLKTLWDYLGLPINVKENESHVLVEDNTNVKGIEPTIYLKRAYNKIYNDMYRNENYEEEIDLDSNDLQIRCWRADYFTKSLPWQQKPSESNYFALPVSTTIMAGGLAPIKGYDGENLSKNIKIMGSTAETENDELQFLAVSNDENKPMGIGSGDTIESGTYPESIEMRADLSDAQIQAISTAFDISDLRLAGQMQKWAERNARGGSRYDEMLRMHFAVTPRDARLQLPEFIGGFKFPIMCGENYSTVETTGAPQGKRAGIGNGMGGNKIRKYFVEEYGIIMGIASILPQASYQQGMPREWIKHNQLDFYHHELCCLSEREVYQGELVCSNDASTTATTSRYNKLTFGFQGMYNEYRYHPNIVTGEARVGELACWHQSRLMSPAYTVDDDNKIVPETNLGADFVKAKDVRKSCFATPSDELSIDPFIITGHFGVKAFRPMTYRAEPGLFDHF